jgi:hypothetical protein
MTDHQPTGDDPGDGDVGRSSDNAAVPLAALALVRLYMRKDPVDLSVDLLTDDDGGIDLDVIQELVHLSAELARALAALSDMEPEQLLDDLVREVVDDDGREQP